MHSYSTELPITLHTIFLERRVMHMKFSMLNMYIEETNFYHIVVIKEHEDLRVLPIH